MFSFGTEFFFAFWMASNRVGLPDGSPPPVRTATSTFLIKRAKSLPRLASITAFLCLVVAHFEWPDITPPSTVPVPRAPVPRRGGVRADHRRAPGGRRSRADCPVEPRQSYRPGRPWSPPEPGLSRPPPLTRSPGPGYGPSRGVRRRGPTRPDRP